MYADIHKLLFFVFVLLFSIVSNAQTYFSGGTNTPPVTPATIPYSCSFDDPNENAQWVLSNSTNISKWFIGTPTNTQLPISGGCLYVSSDNGVTASYDLNNAGTVVATRNIEFNGATQYLLNFDLFIGGESSLDYLKVFLIDVDSNYVGVAGSTYPYYATNTFATNQLLTNYAGTAPYFNGYNGSVIVPGSYPRQIVIPNQGPAGTVKKLVFVWKNDGSVGTMPPATIDNISLIVPSCPSPSTPVVSNILLNSVDLTWTENGAATQWLIEYKLASETNWNNASSTVASNTASSSLTGLLSNTNYNARIKAVCGSGDESIWLYTSFLTACDPFVTLPFSDFFDNYTSGSFPQCWSKLSSNTNPVVSTSYKSSGPNSMYMYTTSGNYNYLVMPTIDPSVSLNSLSAYFRLYKTTAAYNITVGVMSDPANFATFDSIVNFTPSATSTWQFFSVNFANYTGTGRYIAFKVQGFGAANGMYIDDFTVMETPTCNIPTGLIKNSATFNSMELDWSATDDANCAGWIVEYKPYDDLVWQSAYTTSHPFTISNLVSNVVYRISVKAVCISGDTTLATDIANFGLPCEPITYFPWEEGFEDVWFTGNGYSVSTTESRPWCWFNVNGGASATYKWQRTTTASYVRSGLSSMQMYTSNTTGQLGDWMITPVFTFTGNERVKFWAKGYSTYSDDLSVKIFNAATNGVFDASTDTSLFATIMPNTIISATDWTEYEINLSQFVGDYQIAFVRNTTGGYYLNIDDLSISALPTCFRPSNVTVDYITDTEAQISWTLGNPNDAAWWFYYKPATANTYDSVYVTQASYLLQNLTVNTAYSVYVRTDCGAELSEPTSPKTIRTASCVAIATIPWSDSFDSYGTGSTIFPTCWNNKSTSTSYPYVSTTNNSAPGSMYFYASSGYNLALTPSISSIIPVNTLRANFKLKMSSSSYKMSVGIMSDPNDLSTFYEMANISTSSTVWNDYEVNFSTYTGQGTYIAFKVTYTGTTQTIFMDDLVISEVPTCAKPTQLAFSNLTTTSADISWLPGNLTDASWYIYWKPTSATTYDSLLISSNPYTLTNLITNTYYQVYLKTECGFELSQPSDILTFKTPCDAITTIPYLENFDTYGTTAGVFPGCWFRPILYSSTPYPSIVNAYSVSSPTSLRFQSASATQPTYAVTPQIDVDINTLRVLFKLKAESTTSSGTMQVGVMSDPNNVSTFEVVETIVPTSTSFTNYEVFFNNTTLTGTGKYIAFKHVTSSSSYYYWLDDVVVDYIPSCVRPLQVAAHDSTQTSVQITWVPFNISDGAWWLYYKPIAASTFDSVYVTSSPYTLSNLNPSTIYQYYMRTDCGVELSAPTNIYTFNTQCGNIVTLPFADNFDYYGTGTSIMPLCWTRINTHTDPRPYVNTGGRTGNCLYFYAATGTYNIAVMPNFDSSIALNNLRIKFYAKNYSTTDKIIIGFMSDPILANSFIPVDTIYPPTTSWLPFEVYTDTYTGTGTYLAFKNDATTTNAYSYIDDLQIDYIPTCLKPTQVSSSNITLNSADISWTPGTATDNAWWIYWKPALGTTLDSIHVTTMPHQLIGLQQSTMYNVYIKTDCGSDLSEFSTLYSFSTLCGPVDQLPYTENFDIYGTTAGTFPNCWIRPVLNTTTPFPSIVSGTSVSSPGSLKFQSASATQPTYAVTPELNVDLHTLRVLFNLKAESITSSGTIHVGVMSDPLDTSTFELVQVITPSSTSYTNYEVWFDNTTLTGTGNHIAFKHVTNASNYYYWLDDFVVDLIPACARPTQLTATNMTTTSAVINFVPGHTTDASWWIYWKQVSATTFDSLLISSNPYTLTNLLTNTYYQVYLKTDCGTELSQSSNILTFKTPCDAIATVPYTENFDSYGITAGTFPSCWFRPVLNTTTPFPSIVTGSTYVVSSPASLKFQSAAADQPTYAITPQLDVDIHTLRVTFKLKAESTTYSGTMQVGVMSDPSNPTTFELVQIITPTSTSFTEYEISFANTTLTGTGKYIAFKHVTSSSAWYFWLDDVVVDLIPSCPKPLALTASTTDVSATLSWTEQGTATEWEVQYDTANFVFGQGQTILVYDTFATIASLTSNTSYKFYVRSICGIGDTSLWAGPYTFRTQAVASAPYLEQFNASSIPVGYSLSSFYIGSPTGVLGNPPNNIYINLYSSTTTGNFSTINIGPLSANYQLAFEYKFSEYGADLVVPAGSDNFIVAISTDWGLNYVNVDTVVNDGLAGYRPYSFDLSAFNNQIIKIKIIGNWITGDNNFGIDNIYVGPAITCPYPSALVTSNPTTTSIDLDWTVNGTETQWQIEYGAPGFIQGNGTFVTANAHPFTVTLLTPSTTYDFYVRAICSPGDSSIWTTKKTATTACLPFSLPITEGFESSTTIPGCWSTTTTAANYTVIATAGTYPTCTAHGGSNMLYYNSFGISSGNNAVLYSPLLNLTGAPVTVSYWQYRDPGYATYLLEGVEVFYNTNASLTGATSLGFTSRYFATAGWYNITYTIPAGVTGNAYIMFKTNSLFGNNQYIDDINIDYAVVACAVPTNLAVSGITSSTATATWTAGGTEAQWEIAYKPTAASTWNTAFTSAPTYPLPSLTAATPYDVKVRAICGVGDTSAYTAIFNFTTLTTSCPAPTNLAATAITTTGATITWTPGGSETAWELDYKMASASTWTTVNTTAPSHIFTTLTPSTAYNVRVRAICGAGNNSDYTVVVNFTTATPPCLMPTNVAATNITDNSTTITWTPGGSETSWQVEYKISTSTNWTIPAAVSTPSIFLQGLQSNTTYNVRVKALCNPGESAFASAQFTTTGGVIPFTIIASASGPGTITPSGNVQVLPGASQLFTFTPNTGCEVSTLLIDNVNIPNPGLSHNFTNVTADHTIQVTFVTVGIEEGNLAQMVQLYPNPTNATIEIRMNEAQLQVKECRVYDIYGKLMSIVPVNADNTKIDATDFAAGVYFIRMNSEMGVITKKFVKK